jgi:hypothetical protein
MSTGGGPLFGSGGFFGGGGTGGNMGPSGSYGMWPGCGCSSFFIIAAGILLVCGGLLRTMNF